MQRLEEALLAKHDPSSYHLPRMTRVVGFNATDPVVVLAGGYMFWLALTASGKVFACDTGFDGYAGLLPGTVKHGGWHVINEVRHARAPLSLRLRLTTNALPALQVSLIAPIRRHIALVCMRARQGRALRSPSCQIV